MERGQEYLLENGKAGRKRRIGKVIGTVKF